MIPNRSFVLCLLLAGTLGCATDPEVLAHSYLLSVVDDEPPPRRVGATDECDVVVRGGSLFLDASNAFDLAINVYRDCRRGGQGITPTLYQYSGTVTVEGRDMTFDTDTEFTGLMVQGRISPDGTIRIPIGALVPDAGAEIRVGFVEERSPINSL